jgi:hypothetical protein
MAWGGHAGCMGKMRSASKVWSEHLNEKGRFVVLGVVGRIKLKKVKMVKFSLCTP